MACCRPFSWVTALGLSLGLASLAQGQPATTNETRDTQRLAAEELVKAADGARGERARIGYRDGANAYLLIWQTYFADPCRGRDAACSRGDEVLYNASRAFRAAHELERASEVNGTLLDPQFNLHETALAQKTLREEGGVQQALTEYAKAASFYERFAKAAPKDEKAPEALLDAIVLRLGLHEQEAAERNAELWSKLYAAKSPADHAKIVIAIAKSKRDEGASPGEVERYLSANRAAVAKVLSEHQPAVEVMLGTAIAARGDFAAARQHFARAAAFDVLPFLKQLSAEPGATADRRLGKALIAMGDARLWLADQARDSAMKLSIAKSDESLKKKRDAVEEAEKEYAKVMNIQPVPPPIATVEAAARVARMRGQLWAQVHIALGADAAEPTLAQAKAAYRSCVGLGVKYEAITPELAGCARWLERHYPNEHPAMGEIMPRPKWSGTRFSKPTPLDDTGEEAAPTQAAAGRR